MLVLTRKTDEQILIGDNIKITLVRVRGNSVRIGIEAPAEIRIVRGELEYFDSKPDCEGAEFEGNDREQVLAHPQAKAGGGRVKMPQKRSPKAMVNATDPLKEATTPHIFIGRVRPAGDGERLDRPPLAGFVSAT